MRCLAVKTIGFNISNVPPIISERNQVDFFLRTPYTNIGTTVMK